MSSSPRASVRLRATAALAVWTLLVWTTRINNIWAEEGPSAAAKTGRTALALSFTVLAAGTLVGVLRQRRRSTEWLVPLVRGFALWTVTVWAVRAVQIGLADHSAGFVAVHVALAVVSALLAVAAAREVGTLARRERAEAVGRSRREAATGHW
jgi:hypothetical protein